MSSKKKPRPQFEVPADIESGGESGWVYRSAPHSGNSGHADAEQVREEYVREEYVQAEESGSVMDSGAAALFMGFAAIAQVISLGLTIAVLPLTLGFRAFRSLGRND